MVRKREENGNGKVLQKLHKDNKESGRNEVLDKVISDIRKKFGEGSIMRLGEQSEKVNIPVISTGSIKIDLATGIGGIPRRRITEIRC